MTPTLAAMYQTWDPFIWRISGDIGIRWYGVAYLAAFAVAYFIMRKVARMGRAPFAAERTFDILLTLVMGVLLGGRLGYVVLYEPRILITFEASFPFWDLLRLTRGGMSFHGGLAGVMIAAWWVARGKKRVDGADGSRVGTMSLMHLFDVLALATPPGLLLGRLANFINGELLGKIVSRPGERGPWWAVKFPHEIRSGQELALSERQAEELRALVESQAVPGQGMGAAAERLLTRVVEGDAGLAAKLEPLISARHPSQLYQAAGEGLVVGLIVWVVFLTRPRIGVIGPVFMMSYSVMRFVSEFWRLPDSHFVQQTILGMSRGQIYSVVGFLIGIVGFWAGKKINK